MNSPEYTARRATVDDLSGLKILWERARFQVLDLENHLTEFQLIVSDARDLIGALALHIEAKQGLLHSGAFAQPEQEEQFRPQLWERIQSVARNHGLNRLWTQEGASFWLQAGFVEGSAETLPRLPPGFGDRQARWLTLQLKDENVAALSIEHEFELFQTAQKEDTERLRRLGRTMKVTVFVVIGIVATIVLLVIVRMAVKNPSLGIPGPR